MMIGTIDKQGEVLEGGNDLEGINRRKHEKAKKKRAKDT